MGTIVDIHSTKTRLLIGGFIVAAGAIVSYATRGVESPGLVAVLAIALERIFGLSEHLLGHDLHKKLEERSLSPDEILINHDLSKAIAKAFELTCRRIASQHLELPHADRKQIVRIGAAAGRHIENILNEGRVEFRPLAESQVTKVLSGWVRDIHREPLLSTENWRTLLGALASAIGLTVEEEDKPGLFRWLITRLSGQIVSLSSVEKVAETFDPVFQAALRELLKHEFEQGGKAYAALELTVWGELLSQYQVITDQLASSRNEAEVVLSALREHNVEATQIASQLSSTISHRIDEVIQRMDTTERDRQADLLRWLQRIDSDFGEVHRIIPRLDDVVAALRPLDPEVGWKRFAEAFRDKHDRLSRSYFPYAQVKGAVALRCQIDGEYTDFLINALKREERDAEGHKPALVMGEYGQGKSVACGALARELADQFLRDGSRGWLPLLLPLRFFSGTGGITEASLLEVQGIYGPHLKLAEFRAAQASGRLFFIFDGLDELIAHSEQKDVRYYLRFFTQSDILRGNRFVITTRPNVIGRSDQLTELAAFYNIITIELISLQEAHSYLSMRGLQIDLTNIDQNVGGLLRDLVRRPLFLDMIAATRHFVQMTRSLRQLSEANLFESYVRQWYDREHINLGGKLGELKFEEIDAVLSSIGYRMVQDGVDSVSDQEVDASIKNHVNFSLRAELDQLISQGKERLVLVPEFRPGGRRFTFRHSSLQSYFAARYLYRSLQSKTLNEDRLKELVGSARLDDVVLAFFIGQVRNDDSVRELLDSWYEQARVSETYPTNSLGALLLLWGFWTGRSVDGSWFRRFCERAEDSARTMLLGNLQNHDLSHLDLPGLNLAGANLSGANITDTNLRNSDLRTAILDQTSLEMSNLQGANLDGASLKRADLTGTNLSGVTGDGVCFEGAKMNTAVLARCSIKNSDLSSTMLHDADLNNAEFSRVRFTSAELHDANVEGCEFQSCALAGAEFFGTDINKARFVDCDLAKALLDS